MKRAVRPRSELRLQQRFISEQIRKHPARMIVSRMGSGKTGATLDALRYLLDSFTVLRVLIVAPLLVAEETWPEEIRTWAHTRALSFAVAVGTPEKRLAAVGAGVEITIINRENLVWLAKHFASAAAWPYDRVVWTRVSARPGKSGPRAPA
jgi:hypothetical protein